MIINFLDPSQWLGKYSQHYMQHLLFQDLFTSSLTSALIYLIRVQAVQNLVYFCNILSILNYHYIFMKKQPIQSFQEMDSSQNAQIKNIRHFGAVMPIGIREDGEPKYVLGPQYMFFLGTLLVSTIIFTWMGYDIASKTKGRKIQISIALFLSLTFYIYTYIKIGFSNPGIASSEHDLDEASMKNHRYCMPCKIIRQPRTVHCYKCDICIYGYDHHCPWIGKCVGSDNLCAFRLFLFSVMAAISVFSLCVFISGTYEEAAQITGK